jgi:hypothetical protein
MQQLSIDLCRQVWQEGTTDTPAVIFQVAPDFVFLFDYDATRREYVISYCRYDKEKRFWVMTYSEFCKDYKDIYNFCKQYTPDEYIRKVVI